MLLHPISLHAVTWVFSNHVVASSGICVGIFVLKDVVFKAYFVNTVIRDSLSIIMVAIAPFLCPSLTASGLWFGSGVGGGAWGEGGLLIPM